MRTIWVNETENGLDQTTVRQLSDGRFQLTPSYNEQTKGAVRQFFNLEEEALSELSKRGKVKKYTKAN